MNKLGLRYVRNVWLFILGVVLAAATIKYGWRGFFWVKHNHGMEWFGYGFTTLMLLSVTVGAYLFGVADSEPNPKRIWS